MKHNKNNASVTVEFVRINFGGLNSSSWFPELNTSGIKFCLNDCFNHVRLAYKCFNTLITANDGFNFFFPLREGLIV